MRQFAAIVGVACALAAPGEFAPGDLTARAAGAPEMTVYTQGQATHTVLNLQSGFATIIRADRPIDTVAIGDPRLVTATAVHRGADVFDVVLQPQTESGITNMVIWLGALTTVWDLKIGSAPRSADVVLVVTRPAARRPVVAPGRPATAPAPHSTVPATPPASGGRNDAATAAPLASPGTQPPAAASPPPDIELRQTVGAVTAVFRAFRTQDGVLLRYAITNDGRRDLAIKPATILVRVNGHLVAYGMARDSVDRGRPEIVPRGATETGIIDVATPGVRQLELILSLTPVSTARAAAVIPAPGGPEAAPGAPRATGGPSVDAPAARAGTTPAVPIPVVLQATFNGLDRLPVTQTP